MCFTVQLSKFAFYLAVAQTALIFYHVVFDLSRTFFNFFHFILFSFALRNSDIISHHFIDVNKFFHFSCFLLFHKFSCETAFV